MGREGDLAVYFEYDAIDRLTSEFWRRRSDNGQIYGFWYEYDAANNRLAMRREAATGTQTEAAYYAYNAANELIQRKVWTPGGGWVDTYYVYDANGALVREWEPAGPATTYYEYAQNQLVSKIVPSSGPEVVFGYDARLNRYAVVTGGTPVYFNWDGLNPLEQRLGNGTLVARYTHGRSRLPGIGTGVEVERVASGTTYYQFPCFDHRGTAYAVTDENESVQLSYAQDAFGRELAAPGGADPAVPNDLIYQTNWLTLNIGGRSYQLSRYRLYMAELGIFLSRDFLPYPNKYRAWSNNPVGQVDRDGLESVDQGASSSSQGAVAGANAGILKPTIDINKVKQTGEWLTCELTPGENINWSPYPGESFFDAPGIKRPRGIEIDPNYKTDFDRAVSHYIHESTAGAIRRWVSGSAREEEGLQSASLLSELASQPITRLPDNYYLDKGDGGESTHVKGSTYHDRLVTALAFRDACRKKMPSARGMRLVITLTFPGGLKWQSAIRYQYVFACDCNYNWSASWSWEKVCGTWGINNPNPLKYSIPNVNSGPYKYLSCPGETPPPICGDSTSKLIEGGLPIGR